MGRSLPRVGWLSPWRPRLVPRGSRGTGDASPPRVPVRGLQHHRNLAPGGSTAAPRQSTPGGLWYCPSFPLTANPPPVHPPTEAHKRRDQPPDRERSKTGSAPSERGGGEGWGPDRSCQWRGDGRGESGESLAHTAIP